MPQSTKESITATQLSSLEQIVGCLLVWDEASCDKWLLKIIKTCQYYYMYVCVFKSDFLFNRLNVRQLSEINSLQVGSGDASDVDYLKSYLG